MSRPLRLLSVAVAASLALTLAPSSPSHAADPDVGPSAGGVIAGSSARTPAPAGAGPDADAPTAFGGTAPATAPLRVGAPVAARGEARADERRVARHWPVRLRVGDATYHPVTPSGDLSQRFVRVRMTQDRLYGVMRVDATLQGAPTEATNARLRVGFGRISGTTCVPTARSVDIDRNSWGAPPVYQGARIRYAVALPGARTEAYNCGFAALISGDGSTTYDAVTDGRLVEHRQKPILQFRFKGKRLAPGRFTRVPIRIVNTRYTVATAPRVRLRIKTRGVAVRYNRKVGTIKPGQGRKGAIFVKKTGRGTGWVTMIAISKDYRKKIRVPVRPVR
jgi:hypothetical protein